MYVEFDDGLQITNGLEKTPKWSLCLNERHVAYYYDVMSKRRGVAKTTGSTNGALTSADI